MCRLSNHQRKTVLREYRKGFTVAQLMERYRMWGVGNVKKCIAESGESRKLGDEGPSPEEIRHRTERIRSQWSQKDLNQRWVGRYAMQQSEKLLLRDTIN